MFGGFAECRLSTGRGDVHAWVGGSGPPLVLWSARGALPRLYADVLDVWRSWAERVSGVGMPGSHFFAEDELERTASELMAFFDN